MRFDAPTPLLQSRCPGWVSLSLSEEQTCAQVVNNAQIFQSNIDARPGRNWLKGRILSNPMEVMI